MTRHQQSASVIALAALGLAGAACNRPAASAAEAGGGDPPIVAVATVSRGSVSQALTVAAEFLPFQEIDVHAKVAGYVKSIAVDVGDHVRAGQLLAVLEVPELQDDLRQDEAGIKRAGEEVNRADADVQRADSAHEVAHVAATRLQSVLKARPNLVAQQDIDEAAGRDRVAEAQLATSKAALASAREQLEIAKASQNKTKTLLAYTQITAPFAGVITRRFADTGAMIQAGTSSQTQSMPLVKLSQNDRLRLVIPVPESSVSRIHVGAPVTLNVQSLHKGFAGTVARTADRLDTETRTMRVEVDVVNKTGEIVPGMYADVSLVLDEAKDVLVVPVLALDRSGAAPTVLVVNAQHQIEPRTVSVGLESASTVQIARGVADGDLLVIGNRARLKAGSTVSPKVMAASTGEEAR